MRGEVMKIAAGDRCGVSANASKSKPAKLLAVFVVDTNETELTIPFGNRGLMVTRIRTNGNRYGRRRRDVDPQQRLMEPRGQNRGQP
jgi:hypothetical protein